MYIHTHSGLAFFSGHGFDELQVERVCGADPDQDDQQQHNGEVRGRGGERTKAEDERLLNERAA